MIKLKNKSSYNSILLLKNYFQLKIKQTLKLGKWNIQIDIYHLTFIKSNDGRHHKPPKNLDDGDKDYLLNLSGNYCAVKLVKLGWSGIYF